jgi:hypothetical protein
MMRNDSTMMIPTYFQNNMSHPIDTEDTGGCREKI